MTLDQLIHSCELAKIYAVRSCAVEDRETYGDLVGYYTRRISMVRGDATSHRSETARDRRREEGSR